MSTYKKDAQINLCLDQVELIKSGESTIEKEISKLEENFNQENDLKKLIQIPND